MNLYRICINCVQGRACGILSISIVMALTFLLVPMSVAENKSGIKKYTDVEVFGPFYPRKIKINLRTMTKAVQWKQGDPIKEIPRRRYREADPNYSKPAPRLDPLLAASRTSELKQPDNSFSSQKLNKDGQGFSGVVPPDTVGDVGKNYYIQAINGSSTSYTIYNKSDGSVAAGPLSLEDLAADGTNCASGLGDPIVLYDREADRWLLGEFASATSTLCVYISQTSDPIVGGWYNYSFETPNFPDYPKYGVWADAYYVGTNENDVALYALDRDKMLAGLPATVQRVTIPFLTGFGFQMVIPADSDGSVPPPSGSPGYFSRHRDDEVHNAGSNNPGEDYIEIFEFSVDWDTPANTVVSGPLNIAVADFDSDVCGLQSYECFPQPGSAVLLDPLREVIMWRLQYRNFGTHETIMGNFLTDVDGFDHGGIRWFELRKSGANAWSLHQEGTLAPDSNNRWMGSIAMNKNQEIALGYNVVGESSGVYPGLRYSGRLASDPLGTLPQGEYTIVSGTAASFTNRYGDYSAMSVDPSDDCTFWFTGMYNTNPNGQWSTRIGSFSFDSCASPNTIPAVIMLLLDQ